MGLISNLLLEYLQHQTFLALNPNQLEAFFFFCAPTALPFVSLRALMICLVNCLFLYLTL